MSIQGLNDYSGRIQSYPNPSMQKTDTAKVVEEQQELEQLQKAQEVMQSATVEAAPKANASFEDIAITFNKSDDYGYIGKDKDIFSLDIEKAIDNMKRDQVLQRYQFFVGTASNASLSTPDGVTVKQVFEG